MDTNLNLDEIEALANAATPGPWNIGHEAPPLYASNQDICYTWNHMYCILFAGNSNFDLYHDAAFIAAARTAVPALVHLARRQTAEIERLEKEANDLYHTKQAYAAIHDDTLNNVSHDYLRAQVLALQEAVKEKGAEIARIKTFIRSIEWTTDDYSGYAYCPSCNYTRKVGHANDCPSHIILEGALDEATKKRPPVVHIKDPLKMWTPDDKDGDV